MEIQEGPAMAVTIRGCERIEKGFDMTNYTLDEWLSTIEGMEPEAVFDAAQVFADKLRSESRIYRIDSVSTGALFCRYAEDEHTYKEEDALLSGLNRLVVRGWVTRSGNEFSISSLTPPPHESMKRQPYRRRAGIAAGKRYGVYMRDNWTCWLCGRGVDRSSLDGDLDDWSPVLDHNTPHSQGGSDDSENLKTAHNWCNIVRGSRPPTDMAVMSTRVIIRSSIQQTLWEFLRNGELEGFPKSDLEAFSGVGRKRFIRACAAAGVHA